MSTYFYKDRLYRWFLTGNDFARSGTNTKFLAVSGRAGVLLAARGLGLPNILRCTVFARLVAQSCLTLRHQGLYPGRLLLPGDSPGKNTGVGCHAFLQGTFPTEWPSQVRLSSTLQANSLPWATREAQCTVQPPKTKNYPVQISIDMLLKNLDLYIIWLLNKNPTWGVSCSPFYKWKIWHLGLLNFSADPKQLAEQNSNWVWLNFKAKVFTFYPSTD